VKDLSVPSPDASTGHAALTRSYLYVTAAITGASVMVAQILGAKMLAPFLGLSHFVWTAQIAVTLVALAAGYYAGGRLADRTQKLAPLYYAIGAGALYFALTVVICKPVAYWALGSSLAVSSLLVSAILFFVPLALLAMTGPFLTRVITSSVQTVGGNVGRLTSIGTIGSFLGTLLIGYFLIPNLPNAVSMLLTAGLLLALCAGHFLLVRRWAPATILLVLTGGLAFVAQSERKFSNQFQYVVEVFRGNSHFGELQVVERRDDGIRYYLNDNLIQNTYDPERKQSESAFTYMLSGLARAYVTNISDVLCIGLGVGIVPMDFAHQGARVDVVEINPAVVPVGTRYFNFEPAKVRLTIDDGRHFLNNCTNQYDTVVLDAFLGDSSPSHLMTREAFESIRRVLRPGGALVINCFGDLNQGRDFFGASLNRTLKAVFPGVRMHTRGEGAIFFAATVRPDPHFVNPPDFSVVHPRVRAEVERIFSSLNDTAPDRGMILTDNYNPAEFYDAKNREIIRRNLALGARQM
jgi:spermidine synthase